MVYNKPENKDDIRFDNNMRLQAAGIINNFEFDSLILGTSMLKTMSALEASNKLNKNFVNLSMDGSDIVERGLVLNYALHEKKVKSVIYSFDTGLDLFLRKGDPRYPLSKFDFLYDENRYNDLFVYWNRKYIECLLSFSKSSECVGQSKTLVRDLEWFTHAYEKNQTISGLNGWMSEGGRGRAIWQRIKKQIDSNQWSEKKYHTNLAKMKQIIDNHLLPIIINNSDVEFHIVMPPYSRFLYSLWKKKNPKKYDLYFKTVEYLVYNSMQYNNMKVYLFDHLSYLDDINNYRDMRHYNSDMSTSILTSISNNEYIESLVELHTLYTEIDHKNRDYNLEGEFDFVKSSLKLKTEYKVSTNKKTFSIEGWVLSFAVDGVELYVDKQKVAYQKLQINHGILEQYPQYKQEKNSYKFENIALKGNKKNIKLLYKYKGKTIKHIHPFDKVEE
jgi:hypothetical protein